MEFLFFFNSSISKTKSSISNIFQELLIKKVNTDWLIFKRHCEELLFYETIVIDRNKIKITSRRKDLIKKEVKSNRD